MIICDCCKGLKLKKGFDGKIYVNNTTQRVRLCKNCFKFFKNNMNVVQV